MNLQPRALTEVEFERICKRYSETSYAVCRDDLLALLRYVLWLRALQLDRYGNGATKGVEHERD